MRFTRFLALAFFSFTAITTVRLAFAKWTLGAQADLDPSQNPRSSAAWIAQGLAAEREGDFPEAERSLLQAARVDRQYLPAWTLANFYFRRNNAPAFWPWAQRAAAMSYDDLGALLKLCDLLEPQPVEVLERLGESPRLDRAYLDFLIREDRLASAQQVARRMLSRSVDTPRLVDFADRQINAGRVPAALEIWNALAAARLIHFSPIDASQPLTNGELKSAPTGEGFDWRLPPAEGLTSEWRDSQLTFFFSGAQPEACAILEQFVALESRRCRLGIEYARSYRLGIKYARSYRLGIEYARSYRLGIEYARSYRLRFEYSSVGMTSPTGIRWTLDSAEGPALASSELWRPAEWIFTSSPARALSRLKLIYRREPGTTRAQGQFEIRNLRLDAL